MPELLLNGFRGVMRLSEYLEHEKAAPNFAGDATNVSFDLHGNVYVCTGYRALTSALGSGTVTWLYYSTAIQRILGVMPNGDLVSVNPETGAIATHAGAFSAGAEVTYADWTITNKVYIADGSAKFYSLNTSNTLSDLSAGSPLGRGRVLFTHKNHLFSVGPPGYQANYIIPSSLNAPETFDAADAITINEEGDRVNALSSINGVLHAHKNASIFAIFGDDFASDDKNVQVRNLNTGRGASDNFGVWSDENLSYFIAYDGFYRFNGSEIERISSPIDGKIGHLWTGIPEYGRVCGFCPTVGPDAGARYILFAFKDASGVANHVWRYNAYTGDWVQLSMATDFKDFAYSKDHNKTYLAGTKVFYFDNTETWDGTAIKGSYATLPLDAGMRTVDKDWNHILAYPSDFGSTTIYVGLDGLPPTWSLSANTPSGQSVVQVPRIQSHLLTIRAQREGGGTPLLSGLAALYEVNEQRSGRDFLVSRRHSVDAQMTYGKPFRVGQQAMSAATTSYTITHGLGMKPVAVFVTGQGYTAAQYLTVSNVTPTQFTVTVNGYAPVGGEKINWIAIASDMKRLYDSYIRGNENHSVGTTAKWVNHNLDVTPTAVLIQKQADASRGYSAGSIDARQMLVTPGTGSAEGNFYWLVAKSGTDAYFKCGSASSSPITHGLGATPSAVFLFPNQGTIPTYGVTSFDGTTITYSGSGSYYWMCVA